MSVDLSGEITAIATAVLGFFAIVTAVYAVRAFRKQSQEVSEQAEMLRVQSERLETYRRQVEEQHEINATYGEVLELQAREIRASLEERKHAAEEERRSQAVKVTAWLAPSDAVGAWEARIRNASDLPIFDVRTFFHKLHRVKPVSGGGNWVSVGQVEVPPDQTICVFRPESDRTVAAPEKVQEMFGQVNDRTCVVSIEFTDANGSRWQRDPRGALVSRELSGQ